MPDTVRALIAGQPYEVVWRNELGGLTFKVLVNNGVHQFIKWSPAGSGIDLSDEIARLTWAAPWVRVPKVIDSGSDPDGAWMITAGLPGDSAVDPRWLADPDVAVTAIGEGLRALHETLPVSSCPFSWSTDDRIADARDRAAQSRIDPDAWRADHPGLDLPAALHTAATPPPIEQLVVCHGDACAPNTLVGTDGRWSAHVDLGALGTADRWADLAIATWSTTWNYGPGWENHLLAAYEIDPDPDRTEYYRLLWELGP